MNNKLIFTFVANRTDCPAITPHTHNCHELVLYSKNAKGIGQFGDTSYRFSEGGIALIKKGCYHSEIHHSTGKVICIGFKTDRAVSNLYCKNMHELESVFEAVGDEAKNQLHEFEEMVSCKTEEILISLSRATEVHHSEMKNLAHCKAYIKENYAQNINIAEVASIIGYSADHFRHMFKKAYGISPQGYLIERRLSAAYAALKSTDFSCAHIAEINGFSNASQLTRMIKERYGKTPMQLRNDPDREVSHLL